MDQSWITWLLVAEIGLLTGVSLLLPRIGRRGLLFGSYVGDASSGPEAADIRRRWDRGVVLAGTLAVAVSITLALLIRNPVVIVGPILMLAVAIVVLYLQCHREARALARRMPSAVAAATVAPTVGVSSDPLPWISIAVGIAGGLVALIYSIQSYDAMPARVPIHFGLTGQPDGWAARSFGSVFIVPLMTLVMGIVVGGAAILTARVSLSARSGDASVEAQRRFRRAVARFLAVVAIITSTMLTTMSIFTTRTAVGAATGLPPWSLAFVGVLLVYTLGGALYLAVRYGQGGARLEPRTAGAPLTHVLDDDRFWKLGVFYVNPEDPSWLVEKRFGFGYTLNFGNRAALLTCATAFLLVAGLAVWALVSM